MAGQGIRSYEMTEIVERGLTECLTEASAVATPLTATLGIRGVLCSTDGDGAA